MAKARVGWRSNPAVPKRRTSAPCGADGRSIKASAAYSTQSQECPVLPRTSSAAQTESAGSSRFRLSQTLAESGRILQRRTGIGKLRRVPDVEHLRAELQTLPLSQVERYTKKMPGLSISRTLVRCQSRAWV